MSLLQLGRTCHKHPQERVVGVCSACLAQKLTTLIYPHPASVPAGSADLHSQLGGLPLQNSPPRSTNPLPISTNPPPRSTNSPAVDHEHLQTIDEEEDSASEVISHEGLNDKSLEAPNLVEADDVAACPLSDTAQLTVDHHQEIPSSSQRDNSLDKKASIVNQEISLINVVQPTIGPQEKTPTASLEIHARKPAKCRRSKSLSVLGAESLKHVDRTSAHGEELVNTLLVENTGDPSAGVKKVTLRALFQLDDVEKQRVRDFESTLPDDFAHSSECTKNEEDCCRDSFEDVKKINEEHGVHETPHNHTHNSRCCVPSASSLSSSVCPPMPAKIRQSVLLNSLLCRKRRDGDNGSIRKPSWVHQAKRKNANEDGCTQAIGDGGFIRATYIASESRSQSMRRCKSKVELFPTRSSFSCSEPASPGCISHVDSRSECKFNFAARALAIEIPSLFQASIGAEEVVTNAAAPRRDKEQSQSSTRLSIDWTMSQHPIEILACEGECGNAIEIQPNSKTVEMQEKGDEGKLLPTPDFSETLASNTEISSISNRSSMAEEVENRTATENELIEVCQRAIGSNQRWPYGQCPHVRATSPSASYATAMGKCSEGEGASKEHWRRESGVAGEEGATEKWGTGQAATGGPTWYQRTGETEHREAGGKGATENWQGGGAEDMEAGEEGATEYWRAGEAGGGTEHGGAGEGAENAQAEYERSVSCKAAGAQQQHVIWEPYRKSGKNAGKLSRAACRWPPSASTVRVAPDHPLLRFYLTPLRSSGRTRSRHYRSPKRHFWSLIFAWP